MATMKFSLCAFQPILSGSWDVPFTAQEESARILFMTEGEGAETLKSVQPYVAKYCPAPRMAPLSGDVTPFELSRVGTQASPHPSPLAVREVPVAVREVPVADPVADPGADPVAVRAVSVADPVAVRAVSFADPVADSVEVPVAVRAVYFADSVAVPVLTCAELEASLETPFQMVMKALKPPTVNANGIKTVVARNLPRDIKDYELRPLFAAHTATGLRDLYIPRNTDKASPYYGTLKGFALVKFHTAEESTRAFLANLSLCIRGKNIALEFAKEDRAF